MKVAFWGESAQSNAGINMRAVASVFLMLYPEVEVGLYTADTQKRAPAGKGPFGKRRVSGPERKHGNFTACRSTAPEDKVREKLCFIDCGSGMDDKKRKILKQAEIVVVNLWQDEREIHRFFLEEARFLPQSLILISNYCSQSRLDKKYLERVYRAEPERIMVISENTEFDYASARGRAMNFVSRENRTPGSLRNQRFLEELKVISQSLLRHTGFMCGAATGERENR